MSVFSEIKNGGTKIAVIGMGYVGMPLALAFARKGAKVVGFDINTRKIALYRDGKDPTGEAGDDAVMSSDVFFTSDENALKEAKFFVIAVPTPINSDHTPDLTPVIGASKTVGRHLSKGSIVVYESTVYPGCTEDVCVPVLERFSGLSYGKDFRVGYSPERINPGDKVHRLENIKKIVSGNDAEALEEISNVYGLIIEAGTFPVSNIRTAEAVKVAENSQRDLNIAFVNELATVFDRMDIDTNEVVDGMNTKWNALGFRPGLVGGHCIGVDPYYFTYQAERLGCRSRIISNGRAVNDGMASFVADAAVRKMIEAELAPKKAHVVILGLTFKENCRDTRNSRVADIVKRLGEYGIVPEVADPWADPEEAQREYDIKLTPLEDLKPADCVICAVAHREFKELGLKGIEKLLKKDGGKVFVDVKSIIDKKELEASGLVWWRL